MAWPDPEAERAGRAAQVAMGIAIASTVVFVIGLAMWVKH